MVVITTLIIVAVVVTVIGAPCSTDAPTQSMSTPYLYAFVKQTDCLAKRLADWRRQVEGG